MDAKELRIGNWILDHEADPKKTIYYQVEEIQRLSNNKALNQTLGVTYRKGSCWTCDVEPIPLTEEWLVKFGFDNLGAYGWGIGYFHIRFRNIHKFYFLLENRLVRIKYVHQLQNLYFALTNEELKIK